MKIPLLSKRRISVNNTYTPEPVDERRAAEGTKTPETRPSEAMPHRAKDWIIWIVALAFACFHLYTAMTGSLLALYQRSIHFAFAGILVFLTCPSQWKHPKLRAVGQVWDILLVICAVVPVLYMLLNQEGIINRFYYIQKLEWYEYLFCGMLILAILEGTRRKMGMALPIIACVAMGYMLFGKYLPGFLGNGGFSMIAFVDTLYLTTEGPFGIALGASATFVVLFVIFGAFLEQS